MGIIETVEFDVWRYIALIVFYIIATFIAYNYGFMRSGIQMYWYCKDIWNIKDEEDKDNAD